VAVDVVAGVIKHASNGIADDRVACPPDVDWASRVRGRVLDDNAGVAVGKPAKPALCD